jgi:ABC-type multidrug transport system ATPase subunit
MKISLDHIGKRFRKQRIFKDISYTFTGAGSYALLGANGSGKSTLLRIIAGMQSTAHGKVQHEVNNTLIEAKNLYKYISFCAPGMELVEELNLREFLSFHFSFKRPIAGLDIDTIITLCGLEHAATKAIADYSSGMKQRVKLAQAIFSDTPFLFLDEPCTNLDQQGVTQYNDWIQHYAADRLLIIASNEPKEYSFCKELLDLEKYK